MKISDSNNVTTSCGLVDEELERNGDMRSLMVRGRRHSPGLDNPKISVVIPAYNEKNTIEEILRRVLDATVRREIIVVDDCSTDGTRQMLKNMAARQAEGDLEIAANDGGTPIALSDLRFLFQEKNRGKTQDRSARRNHNADGPPAWNRSPHLCAGESRRGQRSNVGRQCQTHRQSCDTDQQHS